MLHAGLDQHATASKAQPSQQSTTMIGSGVSEQLDKTIATITRDVRCQCSHRRRTTHPAPVVGPGLALSIVITDLAFLGYHGRMV